MRKKHILKNERGAAAVEFGILLLPLTLMIVGMMFFGIIFNSYLEITHAAREGVRWAALREDRATVEGHAKAAAPGIDWSKASIDTSGVENDPPTSSDQGSPITVTVTYDITDIKAMLGPFDIILPDVIGSSATQRVE